MEKEKKNNKKKIIIIISIILGVLLVGVLSYITYDKAFKKDNEVKEETIKEENNQGDSTKEDDDTEEVYDEEEYNYNQIDGEVDDDIEELYDFLVTDQYFGLYSKSKITKDSNNTQLFGVLFRKYVEENNAGRCVYQGYEGASDEENVFYISGAGEEEGYTLKVEDIRKGKTNVTEKEGFILKNDFYKWVKESYNIDLSNVQYNFDNIHYFMNVGDYFVNFVRPSTGFGTESYRKIDKVK